MANIRDYLAQILSARYGKDVRNAIHDSIEEINNVNEANIATVQAIADDAEASATSASTSAGTATTKANQASASATLAESWTVGGTGTRTGEDTNNAHYWEQQAKYWHDQAEQIAESLSGALRPMGTITFANLPSVSSAKAGDMYNISDAFTTTSDFVEGAGIQVPLGSNVYMTTHQKWDVLAGSPVTGVKGNSESTYRRGNVNITKTDIGLGNVDNESLGTTDISSIGDGTVKGAISELNSDLGSKSSASAVKGNDAFSKIATLNSKLAPLVTSAARTLHYGTSGTQSCPSAKWWTGTNKLTLPKGRYIVWVKTRETTNSGYASLTGLNNKDNFTDGYLHIAYISINGGNLEAAFYGTGTIYYEIEAVSIV